MQTMQTLDYRLEKLQITNQGNSKLQSDETFEKRYFCNSGTWEQLRRWGSIDSCINFPELPKKHKRGQGIWSAQLVAKSW